MDFKPHYSVDEMASLAAWYEKHRGDLPATLQTAAAVQYTNLPATVRTLLEIYDLHAADPAFAGQIYHLWQIKDALVAQGFPED